MSADPKSSRTFDFAIGGGALLMILCCAVGPAVIGAVAGSAIGGWLGIACAIVLAATVGSFLHRRTRERSC